jgi:hypothetical protein
MQPECFCRPYEVFYVKADVEATRHSKRRLLPATYSVHLEADYFPCSIDFIVPLNHFPSTQTPINDTFIQKVLQELPVFSRALHGIHQGTIGHMRS